jgi:hypothetical protein
VNRVLAILIATATTGCFYTSPINDRPSTELRKVIPTTTPYRGDPVTVQVDSIDPNGDPLTVTWTATACNAGAVACEATPFDTGVVDPALGKFDFAVRDSVLTRSVRVVAHTEDSLGAPALQDAVLIVDVANHAPVVTIQYDTVGPPGGPTRIIASATDPDDDLDALAFTSWTRMSPSGSSTNGELIRVGDNTADPDRTSADEAYELVPDVTGTWTVRVVVTDPIGTASMTDQPLLVGDDQAPCVCDVFPQAPPPGNTLLLDELRRFSVLVVDDDLDVFPAPSPDDPYYGAAEFTWSLSTAASGDSFVELTGAIDSFVELDPLAYDPGDRLRLRVEVADRIPRTMPCLPDEPTCAIDVASCIQRQTWALEVR